VRNPQALISTSELEAILGDPSLRVFDCTTTTVPPPPGSDVPRIAVPGWQAFEEAHILGADFVDIQGEFSDQTTKLRCMMAPIPLMEAAFGRHGVGPGTRVVLYSTGSMMMSTRFWWMLRALGVDAAVLDGGFDKWRADGRPVESGKAKGYPAATFRAAPRSRMFVDRTVVLGELRHPGTVIVNALNDDLHKGVGPSRYGRPGRIPGCVQVSTATLVDPATKGFVPLADAGAKFAANGVTRDKGQAHHLLLRRAASRPRSTSSCSINSATTTSPSTMRRWASGPGMRRCRSKPVEAHSLFDGWRTR
jgi:thiosulfate/3-mercaptopyruvate sulfurtransferase